MAVKKKAKKKSYQQIAAMALARKKKNSHTIFKQAEEVALGKLSHQQALARKGK